MKQSKTLEIKSALVSIYHKEPARELIQKLGDAGVKIYSTGGTLEFIQKMGYQVYSVEELTQYPSILGGRVKTLHPKVFGGILHRRDHQADKADVEKFEIPSFDLVITDLYPFEETLGRGATQEEIIEKIDIGGISLIRAAAKNFDHTWVIASSRYYAKALEILEQQGMATTLEQRKSFAAHAFNVSSHYDTAIYGYLAGDSPESFKKSIMDGTALRYGENPHQQGWFYGNLDEVFTRLHGKPLSYNNLLDIDSAMALMAGFQEPSFAIIKHTNACGLASRPTIREAYHAALASDPVSAFGGILIANRNIDKDSAYDINELFFEVILAPEFSPEALQILQQKKNRIILKVVNPLPQSLQHRNVLNGVLAQTANEATIDPNAWTVATQKAPDSKTQQDLLFANAIVKHTKSNAIVLVKNKQLLASGTGQTSRVDALKQAIEKAKEHKHTLQGAVMASDAFFPFADCVEIAHENGIISVIQPGGSVRDHESIDFCNQHQMCMVHTGVRNFKH